MPILLKKSRDCGRSEAMPRRIGFCGFIREQGGNIDGGGEIDSGIGNGEEGGDSTRDRHKITLLAAIKPGAVKAYQE
ncbi:MAG: hypothetical protein P1P81_05965 [Desulfobulbales bacterium]|nr:hypothetical protein [Desulfobulbales bacterium]